MEPIFNKFLDILSKGIAAEKYSIEEPLPVKDYAQLLRLSKAHGVIPIIAEALWGTRAFPDAASAESLKRAAMLATISQANKTAEFLSVYRLLSTAGLMPVIVKGMVMRSFYPFPEQRASIDEDFLVGPSEGFIYHQTLLGLGFAQVSTEDADKAPETTYISKERSLCIEVHRYLFPPDSEAYGKCNHFFETALDRAVEIEHYGCKVKTLHPTDHLLYMLCHAYKHFLHSGIGIRQVCDIGMLSKEYGETIDWDYIFASCSELRIEVFAAGLFKISERLGFAVPAVFQHIEIDETDLMEDIISGGLYGAEDIDRLHSSTITLNAAVTNKKGNKKINLFRTIFPPLNSMSGKYSYLQNFPWLLPFAWVERILGYIKDRKDVDPQKSVRIGKERVELLKEYGIID